MKNDKVTVDLRKKEDGAEVILTRHSVKKSKLNPSVANVNVLHMTDRNIAKEYKTAVYYF